ncbi:MAG TPA: ATP-binding protein [Chloroflexota bacterium]
MRGAPEVDIGGSTLRAAVDASPLAIVSLDPSGCVTSWNAGAERIFGWSADEVVGHASPTIPIPQRDESDALLAEVLSGKVVTGLYRRRRRKDGSEVDLNISTAPFHDADGNVAGTVILAEDITLRGQAEEERMRLLAREHEARERAERAAERTSRLQSVSAALSEALKASQVAEAVLTQGIGALGASAGVIAHLTDTPGELEVLASTGYPEAVVDAMRRFPIGARVPLAQAVRTGDPVWIESSDHWIARFPELTDIRSGLDTQASASIPLIVKGSAVGALGLSFREPRSFGDDEKNFTLSLASQCAQALERARLYEAEQHARTRAEAAQSRFEFLAEASQTFASSLDYETTLTSVARLAVPHVADWCSVYVVDGDEGARLIAVAHVDPAKVTLARELEERYPFDPDAPTGVANVLRTGRPELLPDIGDDLLVEVAPDTELLAILRELGLVSAMTVPLVARGRVLGAIAMVSAESGHRYSEADLALAMDLAGRAAVAVDNARLHREVQGAAIEREAILGQISDGLIIADASGTITFMNAAAQILLGSNALGTPIERYSATFQVIDRDGGLFPSRELPLARAVLHGESVLNEDVMVRLPGGSVAILESSATPVIAEDGSRMGGVVTFRDVTMQRSLERQKDDFLSAAAHDLKTPLTTIKGLAQILRRKAERANTPETDGLIDGLSRIDMTTSRMTAMINELLDASRIHMGRALDLVRTPTDLAGLIRHLVEEQQHTTELHSILVEAPSEPVVGDWDAARLERAFTNLLSNAITYSPSGGRVQVTIRIEGELAILTVQDEGLGIPPSDLPHVFERFHRGSNVAGRIPGTGVGLAGARQIVEQHGGTISVESEEGRGTTFTVRLPRHAVSQRNLEELEESSRSA